MNVLIMADAKRQYFDEAAALLKENGIHTVFGNPLKVGEEDLVCQAQEAETVIAGSERWTRRVMEQCSRLKLIVRCGTGYDGVDIQAASEMGIQVANTPGLNTYAVAEMALSFILALQRKVLVYNEKMKKGQWGPVDARELRGKTVGLLGFGGIAKQLAGLLQPFGCRLLAYDIFQDQETAKKLGVEFTDMGTVISEADIISIHLPLVEDTRYLICRETIEKMKPGCILVNTSRGGVVHTADLCEALKEGKLAGVALDVHEVEPVPKDYDMLGMENVILSPHVASATEEATLQMINASAASVIKFYKEGRAEHVVN